MNESNTVAAAAQELGSANFQSASAPADQVTRQGIQMLPALMVMTPRGSIYRTIQGHVSQEYILKLVEEAKAQKATASAEAAAAGMVQADAPGVVPPVLTFRSPITPSAQQKALKISGAVRLGGRRLT